MLRLFILSKVWWALEYLVGLSGKESFQRGEQCIFPRLIPKTRIPEIHQKWPLVNTGILSLRRPGFFDLVSWVCQRHEGGPGQVAQLVGASSLCAKVVGSISSWNIQEAVNECINKWNNKSMFLSFSFSPSLLISHPPNQLKKKRWEGCNMATVGKSTWALESEKPLFESCPSCCNIGLYLTSLSLSSLIHTARLIMPASQGCVKV